jgi:hypothetical protein
MAAPVCSPFYFFFVFNICQSVEEALATLKTTRPGISLNKAQLAFIHEQGKNPHKSGESAE